MGTRNLTIVRSKRKDKVIQYGQWDGYPEGQGRTIADFLKEVDLPKFKKQVDALKVYTKQAIKKAYMDAGHDGGQWIEMSVSNRANKAHPALCRDHGAGIMELIYNGTVKKVQLFSEWDGKEVGEGSWIEYYYIVDLDKKTVQMNGGKKYTFEQWCSKNFVKKLAKQEEDEE